MPGKTQIEWCTDTWNPVTGCSKVSPGCEYCYAERIALRFGRSTKPWTKPNAAENVQLHPERLKIPLTWQRPRRIFVNSVSDLFHELVPDEFVANVFSVMEAAAHHQYLILTKRPERMLAWVTKHRDWVEYAAGEGEYLRRYGHVWLGTSVEDQRRAEERLPYLVETPAAVRFVSAEPLLGELDLTSWFPRYDHRPTYEYFRAAFPDAGDQPIKIAEGIDWVIVGGESGGPKERRLVESGPPFQLLTPLQRSITDRRYQPKPDAFEWVTSLRDQCVAVGVPFFFKQWGGTTPKSGGRSIDFRTWDELPAGGSAVTR
jgi:protein gp37